MDVCLVFVSASSLIFTAILFSEFKWFIYYGLIVFASVLFVFSSVVFNTNSPLHRTLILLNFGYLSILLFYLLMRLSGVLDKINSVNDLKNLIASSGGWGVVSLFFLTVLQVVVLPIPAAVTILIGTFLYGATVSFIVSTMGTIVGSIVCYFIGRKFGYKAIVWVIGRDKMEKYTKMLAKKGKIPFIVMMLFPFFPDDILCMVAGLLKMSFKFFIITVSVTRPVTIAFISYFGLGNIIPFKGWGIAVWLTIVFFTIFVLYIVGYFIKRKNTNKKEK